MKTQMAILLAGMMMVSALLGGCGSTGQPASEQAVSSAESQQESSQQTEAPESSDEGENQAVLDEPYVLVRETDTKSGNVTEYAYDENGDKVSETVTYPDKPDETLSREYTTQYQDDGSKIVTESQSILVKTGEAISPYTYEYEYSPEGLLLRKTGFENGNVDGEILYEYDEVGNLIRQSGENAPSIGRDLTKEFEYDESGNLTKQIDFDDNGEVEGWSTFEYDENGKEIMKHVFTSTGDEPRTYELCQWEYEYDAEGRIIEEWKEGTEIGGKYEHDEYEYDEYGNMCKKKDLTLNTTYEYAPLSACVS